MAYMSIHFEILLCLHNYLFIAILPSTFICVLSFLSTSSWVIHKEGLIVQTRL